MNTVQLESLSLRNFKGAKSVTYSFDPKETFFRGDNGVGKTTQKDALLWLLFGKDSQDRKDFEVKPLNAENNTTNKVDVKVTGIILHNGNKVTIERELKEKWVKKRGTDIEEFSGNETLFWINGVPTKAGEYAKEIGKIVPELTFKLITNPMYFNTSLKWQERREVLISLAGSVNYEDILLEMPCEHISQALSEGKTIEKYRLQLNSERNTLKKELEDIPSRIDELQTSKPVPRLWDQLKKTLALKSSEHEALLIQITNASEKNKAEQDRINGLYNKNQEAIRELKKQKAAIEDEAENIVKATKKEQSGNSDEINEQIESLERRIKSLESERDNAKQLISKSEINLDKLRKDLSDTNDKLFVLDPNIKACPTCKREYENISEKSAELEANFNAEKARTISEIQKNGLELKGTTDELKKGLEVIEENISTLIHSLNTLFQQKQEDFETPKQPVLKVEDILSKDKKYQSLVNEIETLSSKEFKAENSGDTSAISAQAAELNKEIIEINVQLAEKEQTDKINSRIEVLESSAKLKATLMSEIEGQIFDIENLVKERMTRIETSVNAMFSYVTFKLFKTLINGGEEETCEALINGVPFSAANTGSQINAGLDIIKAISKFYNVQAPVVIDNRETVTKILDMDCQVINLFKDEKYSVLTKTEE